MTLRTRFFLLAGAWTLLVTVLLAGVPLLFRERLPAPVAVHWGVSGTPDNAMPLGAMIVAPIVLWVLVAGSVLVVAWRRGVLQRQRRSWQGAALAWGGAFVLGLMALTVWANLDADTWSRARSVSWQVAPLLAVSLAAGWLGWRLARRGPDETPVRDEAAPVLRLRPGERAVWVSSSGTGAGLVTGALVCVAVALGFAVVMAIGMLTVWPGLIAFGAAGPVCLAVSRVRVQVTERGLALGFGPFGWPVRRIPLKKIASARAEVRYPSDVGGWGVRGLPGRSTIMIRGGDCLIVRYTTGGELGISVDDAERGASLLNALIQPRPVR